MKSNLFILEYRSASRRISLLFFAATVALLLTASPACVAQNTPTGIQSASVPGGMSSVSRSASDGKTLHVTVGHSIFVDTKTRLRRVYVADPAILNSVTLTPNEIVVTAMAPGISSLTLLDEAGQAQNYVVSSDLDIDGLRQAMAQAEPNASIAVDGVGGRVTLTGAVTTQATADDAVKLAGLYSKEVVNALNVRLAHPKQVRLEVRILEVDRSKLLQLGINLFNPGGNTNILAQASTSQFPSSMTYSQGAGSVLGAVTTSNPLNLMLYAAKLNLGATIQDLQNKNILQILAEPTITTVSGVKADFLSGGEFPFPMVQPGGVGGTSVVTISFRPYGVKLEFTPIVNADGTITLTVAPEVSALDYSNSVSVEGFSIPALSTRRASTEVELRSNQSFAISGLLDQRTTDILSKTPGVASIPILGDLFKSKSQNKSTTELIVVVTPTVVDPLTEGTVPDQPTLPIPTLDVKSFDKGLGKNAVPNPAPPPLDPDKQPFSNVPPPPPQAPSAATSTSATPASNDVPAVNPVTTQATPPVAPVAAAAMYATTTETPPAVPNSVEPSPATASPQPHTMVEIMALSHESDADAMVAALSRHGYQVAVLHQPQDKLIHLDVGPFANNQDAEAMRQKLLLDGYNATIR